LTGERLRLGIGLRDTERNTSRLRPRHAWIVPHPRAEARMTWRGDMLGFGIAEDLGPKEEPEQRVAPPASNDIRLNGTNIAGLSSAEVARRGTG
jgi:hypothetical protein